MRQLVGAVLCVLALGASGCSKVQLKPRKPVPTGQVVFHFTKKIRGPVDLAINGTRIPVEPAAKGKTARQLVISGLAPGKHHYFLSSPHEAFGPDQGDVELTADKGVYLVAFTQSFKAVLYGRGEALPASEGLPGVKARLER